MKYLEIVCVVLLKSIYEALVTGRQCSKSKMTHTDSPQYVCSVEID